MIRRVLVKDADEVVALLARDSIVNVFLLHCIERNTLERDVWCGRWLGKQLVAVAYLAPTRLLVPWAGTPDAAAPLGDWLAARYAPCLMVGPRDICDAIWSRWAGHQGMAAWYNQQLYVLTDRPSQHKFEGFRAARDSDWRAVADHSASYSREDLGPLAPVADAMTLERTTRDRIAAGRTFVIERDGRLVFQVHVGATGPYGCMVGGTFVPPQWRKQKLATLGMAQVCRELLPTWGRVLLHVNEANVAAVRVYEKVGFRPYADYRLALPHTTTDQ